MSDGHGHAPEFEGDPKSADLDEVARAVLGAMLRLDARGVRITVARLAEATAHSPVTARAALKRLQDARYVLRSGRAVKTRWRPLRDLDGKVLKREAPVPEGATVTRRKGGVRFIQCPPRPAFGVGDTPFDGILR